MPPMDDLPLIPTIRESAYVIPPNNKPSASHAPRKKSQPQNVAYRPSPQTRAQYGSNQPQYQQNAAPRHPSNSLGRSQLPPAPQGYYQHPQHSNSYSAPPPNSYYNQPPPAPTPEAYYHPQVSHQQQPPAPQQTYYQQPAPPPQQSHHSPHQTYQQVIPSNTQIYETPTRKAPIQDQVYSKSKESLHDGRSEGKKYSKDYLEMKALFENVDVNKSGRLSKTELSHALRNLDYTRFQESTVEVMMSSTGGNSKYLNFEQFETLMKYLEAYKKMFLAADTDNSGDISLGESQKALVGMGYRLDIDSTDRLFRKFSYKSEHSDGPGKLKFDKFIELVIYLRKLTDVFKKYDKSTTGVASIQYLSFVYEVTDLL